MRLISCLSDSWATVVMSDTNATFDIFRPQIGGDIGDPTPVDHDDDPETPNQPVPEYVYQDDSGALVYVWPDYEDDDYNTPEAAEDESDDDPVDDPSDSGSKTYPKNWRKVNQNDVLAKMTWDNFGQTTGVNMDNQFKYEQYARALVPANTNVQALDYITDIEFLSGDVPGLLLDSDSYWVRGITPVTGPLGALIGIELYLQRVLRAGEVNG